MLEDKESVLKEWLKFKKAEDKAKKNRIEIENKILTMYDLNFDGSSKTFKEDGLDFSVNIKKNIVYKLDQEKYISIRQEIAEELRPEKVSFSLDIEGYNYLKENELEVYKKVLDCVEMKENKSTVKVEKINK